MRLWHPKHGILHVSDKAEIDRLISTGGTEFDGNNKPWIKKEFIAEIEEEIKVETKPTTSVLKRGRPFKNGNK